MSFLGLKFYNTPVAKTLWPIFAGSAITFYLFSNVAESMSQAPEYINDPNNPYAKKKH